MAAIFACEQCGVTNSDQRFWCQDCWADLNRSHASYLCQLQAELASSAELYERILADLTVLLHRGESSESVCEIIRKFYTERLRAVTSLQGCLNRLRKLGPLGQVPLSGLKKEYQHLQEALGEQPQMELLRDLSKVVREEIKRRKATLLKTATVRRWISAAQSCSDLEESERYLKKAYAIDPGDADISAAMEELRRERQRRLTETREPAALDSRGAVSPDVADANGEVPAVPHGRLGSRRLPFAISTIGLNNAAPASAVVSDTALEQTPYAEKCKSPSARRHIDINVSFAEPEDEPPSALQRLFDAASDWSVVFKPFLLDNVGWFVGAFLIFAGFLVLIAAFWRNIGSNPILMRSLAFWCLALTSGMCFVLAYYMRRKYPRLETSSNVLLIIVALLIPLVFAAAAVTTLSPSVN